MKIAEGVFNINYFQKSMAFIIKAVIFFYYILKNKLAGTIIFTDFSTSQPVLFHTLSLI